MKPRLFEYYSSVLPFEIRPLTHNFGMAVIAAWDGKLFTHTYKFSLMIGFVFVSYLGAGLYARLKFSVLYCGCSLTQTCE